MPDINQNNLQEMLKSVPDRVRGLIADCVNAVNAIKWKQVSFIIPMRPKPSQRPRLSGSRIFVPGAAKNGSFFQRNVLPELNNLWITTPCRIKLDIYVETPASFTKTQKCLAEMRVLRPWTSTGDVDNYEKAVYDMMQPNEKRRHRGIMANDSLIIDAHTNKYYSQTPRYEVTISYMSKVPEGLMKILKMKNDYEPPRF